MSKSKPITEKDAWLSDEEMEYFEQAYSELEPGTVPEKSKTTEEIEDEDTKKFFEYKDMWRWWGSLFLDEDLNLIESYMKQIGTRVGLRMFEKEKTMSDRVKEYVAVTDGWFSVTDLYRELQIVTPQDKSTVRVNIKRLYDVGFIEKHGSKNGVYRKPDYAVEEIDWLNSDDKPVKILLPLGLHEHVSLYGGDIVVVAGKWNAGKSAFLMETARLNLDLWKIDFLTSEMKGPRFKKRMKFMRDELGVDLDKFDSKVRVRGRDGMFQDIIEPNKLTLADYLQVNEDFYRVGAHIRAMADKLERGIVIVALQKDAGAMYGYGAQKGLQRPTLYLTIDDGVVKIVKAKDWVTSSNPNGKIQRFKLYKGVNFQAEGILHYEEDDPQDKKGRYG